MDDFPSWYGKLARRLGLDPNPDSPEHHYDYRALYQDVKRGTVKDPVSQGGHFPSDYKTEGHPRTYLDDSKGRIFDTRSGRYVTGGGQVPAELLQRSEESPDMAGWKPHDPMAGWNGMTPDEIRAYVARPRPPLELMTPEKRAAEMWAKKEAERIAAEDAAHKQWMDSGFEGPSPLQQRIAAMEQQKASQQPGGRGAVSSALQRMGAWLAGTPSGGGTASK